MRRGGGSGYVEYLDIDIYQKWFLQMQAYAGSAAEDSYVIDVSGPMLLRAEQGQYGDSGGSGYRELDSSLDEVALTQITQVPFLL